MATPANDFLVSLISTMMGVRGCHSLLAIPARSKACNRIAPASPLRMRTYWCTRKSSKIQLFYEYVLTKFRSITALESGRTKQWGGVLLDHRLRLRTYSQPAPSHCPHGFSSRLPVARQAGQASQSALFAPLPMTPVQRLPAVTCEHWPLIISSEYDNAPQRVQTATGCAFWLDPCSGLVSGVWLDMGACNRLRICLFWKRPDFGSSALRATLSILVIPGEPLRGQGGRLWFCNIPAIKQLATSGIQSKNVSCRYSWSI